MLYESFTHLPEERLSLGIKFNPKPKPKDGVETHATCLNAEG